ncbi:MAG: glycosyltransferase family 4 protein [Planctomycetota bacterium]
MRVVALVESLNHVCVRYRTQPFVDPLAALGISLEIVPIPRNFLDRCRLLWRLQGCNVVILRKLLGIVEWKILRTRAKWIGFELDDAVFLRDSYSEKGFHDNRRSARFRRIANESDAIIAGNKHLACVSREYGSKGIIEVIPTSVNMAIYDKDYGVRSNKHMSLVWIGSSSTLQGLDRFRNTLEKIGQTFPDVVLKLICDKFLKFNYLRTEEIPWTEKNENRDISTADIGISWIPDDPWSKGKCGLKVIQYMASGLPVVANSVGVHPEMIQQGCNGFLADNNEDWIRAINQLLADASMRKEMGNRSRQIVKTCYSTVNALDKWVKLFKCLKN